MYICTYTQFFFLFFHHLKYIFNHGMHTLNISIKYLFFSKVDVNYWLQPLKTLKLEFNPIDQNLIEETQPVESAAVAFKQRILKQQSSWQNITHKDAAAVFVRVGGFFGCFFLASEGKK